MAVDLSIEKVPDAVVERLRVRAARHRRSLQAELLAIIEEPVRVAPQLSPDEVLAEVQRMGLSTPAEAVTIVRDDRDHR